MDVVQAPGSRISSHCTLVHSFAWVPGEKQLVDHIRDSVAGHSCSFPGKHKSITDNSTKEMRVRY